MRFTFQRMIGCMGKEVLPFLEPLVKTGLLSASSASEINDFLPFLGYVIHTFKPHVYPIFNSVYSPLIERIFYLLNQPINGTDDAVAVGDLGRSYLVFLGQMLAANLDGIFLSDCKKMIFTI